MAATSPHPAARVDSVVQLDGAGRSGGFASSFQKPQWVCTSSSPGLVLVALAFPNLEELVDAGRRTSAMVSPCHYRQRLLGGLGTDEVWASHREPPGTELLS